MNELPENERRDRLERARRKMTELAITMQQVLPAIDVAGVLIAAAVGILENEYGSEKAAQYLRELALEVGTDTDRGHGHA